MKALYRVVGPQEGEAEMVSPGTAGTLEAHRDSLYRRLEMGYERIERGLAEGGDVTTWEDFWIGLLREYESVCDELQRDLAA